MYRDVFDKLYKDLEQLEGPWDKVSLLEGDRGGYTQGGLAETANPEIAHLIREGKVPRWIHRGAYVRYFRKFTKYGPIPRPLLALFFYGDVHGVGDNHYLRELQTWLNNRKGASLVADGLYGPRTARAVRGMTAQEVADFISYLGEGVVLERLQNKRVRAVGAPNLAQGIANRVSSEIQLATGYVDPTMVISYGPDELKISTIANVKVRFLS